ncbi:MULTISPECIES: hypothetical protein [Olivibacter]|jgi:hypothetical protein|uniref:Bacteriocin n=3 Tax=Sphingobacteriaceae TaxID=84566 RepID=F4C8L7_SPHS2|nr:MULTISPECIES: hypothetical protein [Olivibacter]MCL4638457.1 hypothetical protein [Olivibacter sp. UJ_SKK_5.1]MDM8175821.1 hypothetical protein [Olivibacter sp. 47]MDX3914427.1 hypothetical protein [Pseudosphingobacterium sp.]QEL02549.1 hypothetical protein FKG96_17585 [Olivibacter sp. LS-1]
MKKLDLNNLGVEEMNATELRTVEGGGPVNDLLNILVGGVGTVLNDTFKFVNKTLVTIFQTLSSL